MQDLYSQILEEENVDAFLDEDSKRDIDVLGEGSLSLLCFPEGSLCLPDAPGTLPQLAALNTCMVSNNVGMSLQSGASTCASYISIVSSSGVHPKCFVPGTCFRSPNGGLVPVEDVQQHEALVGTGGQLVEVAKIIPHESESRQLTLLRAGDIVCVVTSDHRVVVPRPHGQQTIPAGHLLVGDRVLCEGGERRLDEVEQRDMQIRVYEATFKPDIAIQTFYRQETAMLTKGAKLRIVKTRRSGMNHRASNGTIFDDASIPATHDSWV